MTAFAAVVFGLAFLIGPRAAGATKSNPFNKAHGSTEGLLSNNPEWSAGAQFGNYGATGVVAQMAGFAGGELNLGLGLDAGNLAGVADYVTVFGEDWRPMKIPKTGGYNHFRGQLNPYLGAGLEVERGFFLRVPMGLQYTMLKDPFNFFGGIALMLGPFFSDQRVGPKLWFNLGARVLL